MPFCFASLVIDSVPIVRHTAWAAAAAVILTGARFSLAAIVARRLSQDGFGQFAYAQWLIDLAFLVCSLGATGVISRYAAEYRTHPDKLATLMMRWRPFAFGLPVLTSGGVFLGALLSGLHPDGAALSMLALWSAASGFWSMQTAALMGLQRFDLVFRTNVLAAVIMLIGVLMMPLDGADVAPLFGLMAIACAAAATVGHSAIRPLVAGSSGSIKSDEWRSIRGYAFNIWLTALLWSLVWSRGEMPIVRAYLGDTGVAQYAAAMALFGGAIQGVMLAVSGVAPQLALLWGSGRRDEAIAVARTVMDMQLLLCGVGALLLICLGPDLVSLVFGNAYRQAAAPLSILAIGLLAMAVSSQNYVLQIATNARFSRNTTLLGLVLLFGSAVLLTPLLGLTGAAISRTGTILLLAVVSLVVVNRRWEGAAISGRNVVIVVAVVGVTAVAAMWKEGSMLLMRLGLLGAALVVLAALLSDKHGRLLVHVLTQMAWTNIVRSKSGARNDDLVDKVKTP
jgi:O-antigen/teichoic acid export membrane protein